MTRYPKPTAATLVISASLGLVGAALAACDDDVPAPPAEVVLAPEDDREGDERDDLGPPIPPPELPEVPRLPILATGDLEAIRGRHGLDGDLEATRRATVRSVTLREAPIPDAEAGRTLPGRTIVVAFFGDVGGHASRGAGDGASTFVVASDGDAGFVPADALSADEGALPAARPLLEALPPRIRASHGGRMTVSRLSLGDGAPGVVTVAEAEHDDLRVTHLAFFSIDDDGGAEVVSRHRLGGWLTALEPIGAGAILAGHRSEAAAPDTEWVLLRATEGTPTFRESLPNDVAPRLDGSCAFALPARDDDAGERCFRYDAAADRYAEAP